MKQTKLQQQPTVYRGHDRKRTPYDCGDQQRTKQSFKDDCDINLIVKRHASTGLWSHLTGRVPMYGDFSQAQELQDAITTVNAAENDFLELPAAVRRLCANDPVTFYQMMGNEKAVEQLAAAGLPMAEGWKPAENETTATKEEQGEEKPPKDEKGTT